MSAEKRRKPHCAASDPSRSLDEEDQGDLALFARLVRNASEGVDVMSRADAMWRLYRVVRGHESIIRTYGRYPCRNAVLGRPDTSEEIKFLVLVDNFEVADEHVAQSIKEDVQAGRIRPLQASKPDR